MQTDLLHQSGAVCDSDLLAQGISGFGLRLGLGGEYFTAELVDGQAVRAAVATLLQARGFPVARAISRLSVQERKAYMRRHQVTENELYQHWQTGIGSWLREAEQLRQTEEILFARRERVLCEFGLDLSYFLALSSMRQQRAYLDRVYRSHLRQLSANKKAALIDLIAERLIRACQREQGTANTPVSVFRVVAHVDAALGFLASFGEKTSVALRELVILTGFQQATSEEQEALLVSVPVRITEPLSSVQQEILMDVKKLTTRFIKATHSFIEEHGAASGSVSLSVSVGRSAPVLSQAVPVESSGVRPPAPVRELVTEVDIQATRAWLRQNPEIWEDFTYRVSLRPGDPALRERELLEQIAKTVKDEERRIQQRLGTTARSRPAPLLAGWERQQNTGGISTCTLASIGNALRALGKYDERETSEAAMIELLGGEQFLRRHWGRFISTHEVGRLLKLLAQKQGIVVQRTGSIADLLSAVEDGAAAVISLGAAHAGAVQPGERVFWRSGELWLQVVDPLMGERHIRVEDLLHSEIVYSQGVGIADAAPAFIVRGV